MFNPARRGGSLEAEYPPQLAAMLVYLNRTGFNVLYRLNARGEFNVPAGRYTNPRICDPDNLRAVSVALRSPGVQIVRGSFESVREYATSGDFIYFDPPYAPLSATASFTSYTESGFSSDDQRSLQKLVIEFARRGCQIVVSNSTAPVIVDLYEHSAEVRKAGLVAHRVPAKRAINSNASRRGAVMEFIISNVRPSN
jgi:DNA adenine methylase